MVKYQTDRTFIFRNGELRSRPVPECIPHFVFSLHMEGMQMAKKEWTKEERYRVLKDPEEIRDLYERITGTDYRQTYHIQPVTGLLNDPGRSTASNTGTIPYPRT